LKLKNKSIESSLKNYFWTLKQKIRTLIRIYRQKDLSTLMSTLV